VRLYNRFVLKIGEFSALAQVSIRTLRHYDEVGLLKPMHVEAESGFIDLVESPCVACA
jgi:predicted site-specific integrase-resolvase